MFWLLQPLQSGGTLWMRWRELSQSNAAPIGLNLTKTNPAIDRTESQLLVVKHSQWHLVQPRRGCRTLNLRRVPICHRRDIGDIHHDLRVVLFNHCVLGTVYKHDDIFLRCRDKYRKLRDVCVMGNKHHDCALFELAEFFHALVIRHFKHPSWSIFISAELY